MKATSGRPTLRGVSLSRLTGVIGTRELVTGGSCPETGRFFPVSQEVANGVPGAKMASLRFTESFRVRRYRHDDIRRAGLRQSSAPSF
jgi:hypothetical protein